MHNENSEIQRRAKLPVSQYLTLQDASQYTGVPFDTLVWANSTGKLAVTRIYTGGSHVLWVHAGALCYYMINDAPEKYRWVLKPVEITSLKPHIATQVRPIDPIEVEELADQYRLGGTTPPVWTLIEDGVEYIVDGYHRTAGRLSASQTEIDAIRVRLPIRYARAIAIYVNERHGRRIKDSDLQALVIQHLDLHPQDRADLAAGKLSMGELADMVCVSVSTVSRALEDKVHPAIDPLAVFADLQPLNKHLTHRAAAQDALFIAFIYGKALGPILAGLTREEKADFKRRIQLNATPVCAAITPRIRNSIFRQGGARKRGKPMTAGADPGIGYVAPAEPSGTAEPAAEPPRQNATRKRTKKSTTTATISQLDPELLQTAERMLLISMG